jgi:flagellar biosynthesis/type III secretory pathway chaperone
MLELIEVIGAEVGIFERFLQTLQRQQDALVDNNLDLLNETTAELEVLTSETKKAESRRQKLVAQVTQDLELSPEDINLSQLAALANASQASELSRLQQTLLDLHEQIQESKNRNEFLIKKSMEYLDATISQLSGEEQSSTYQPDATAANGKRRPLSLDRKV